MYMKLRTEIPVYEPSTDGGFVNQFAVEIYEVTGVDEERRIGEADVVLVHADAAATHDDLFSVMDAVDQDIHELYCAYLQRYEKGSSFCEKVCELGCERLLYISQIKMDEEARKRNVDLAVARRLADTIGAGASLVVIDELEPKNRPRWRKMGFRSGPKTYSGPKRTYMHLVQDYEQPRVVDGADGQDCFVVVPALKRSDSRAA